ncbi:sugar phosphate permease [Cupriavidus gilardii J11]|uniref:Sugar phosphate permease n=1 Tax=Cupriavidus gilardii J11 TaxID=936133 RepID=A0A562B3E1_9BURK|nr:MFS transporter [Cupriavidus gilardii]TWG79666.1 sugar phosphate permease [Cupriavidus gilardii J11]
MTTTTLEPPHNPLRHDAQVIGLVGLAHGVSHFFHLILAPLFPWIKAEFALSYAELGLLMTVFFAVSAVVQTLSGFVVDRFGARPVLFGGIALLAASAMLLASAPGYVGLLAGAAVAGLGNGVFHPADFTLLNKHVSQPRLGHAFSVHGISGNLGWAAAPVFLVTIANLGHWRTALASAALVALAVLAILVINRHLLDPAGPAAAAQGADKRRAVQADGGSLLGFLKLPQVWVCWAFFLITTFSLSGIQSFAPTALTQLYAMPLTLATACYTIYMLSSAAGMLAGGFAAGRTGNHDRLIAASFTVSGLTAILVGATLTPALAVPVLMAVIGLGAGVAGPSRDLLVRAAAPAGATGRVYGVVYSGLDIGLATGPLFFGALMDARWPNWLFYMIGSLQLLAILTAVTVGNGNRQRAADRAGSIKAA